jgi:hypothetical protein
VKAKQLEAWHWSFVARRGSEARTRERPGFPHRALELDVCPSLEPCVSNDAERSRENIVDASQATLTRSIQDASTVPCLHRHTIAQASEFFVFGAVR